MLVKGVVGEGITDSLGLAGADLGILRWDQKRNALACLLGGDNGPSIVMYTNTYEPKGIPTVTDKGFPAIGVNKPAQSLWDVERTTIPTDFIYLNGRWIVSVMICEGTDVVRTEFYSSADLSAWEPTPALQLDHSSHPGYADLSFSEAGPHVYVVGTGGPGQPIWLWRADKTTFPLGTWSPYGRTPGGDWEWGVPNEDSPVLLGSYGELCLRSPQDFNTPQKAWVLSYFDVDNSSVVMVSFESPEDIAYSRDTTTIAYAEAPCNDILDRPGEVIPHLHGGYVSPLSVLDEPGGMKLFIGQRNPETNDPYTIYLVTGTLSSSGLD